MNKLIAIVSFALSLYGCDVGGSTFVHRSSADGSDVLYSKVVAKPGLARFECLRSASGQCFYTLYSRDCATAPAPDGDPKQPPVAACIPRPVQRFALASGQSRQVPALSAFRMCVSTEPEAAIPGCEAPDPIATL